MKKALFVLLLAMQVSAIVTGAAATIELKRPSGEVPFSIVVTMTSPTDFLIERSSDLSNWHGYISVFPRVASFYLWQRYVLQSNPPPTKFYRVSRAARSIEELRNKWLELGATKYRFDFLSHCSCLPGKGNIHARLTVETGKVTAIENPVFYPGGAPVENPDPSQFRTIDELFSLLLDYTQTASPLSDLVAVEFDENQFFPRWIYSDYFAHGFDDEREFFASNLEILP